MAERRLLVDAEAAEQIVAHLVDSVVKAEAWIDALTPRPDGDAIVVDDEYTAPRAGVENAVLRSLRDEQRRTIAALEAERDAARAAVERWKADFETLLQRANDRVTECDVASTERDRLRAVLRGEDEAAIDALRLAIGNGGESSGGAFLLRAVGRAVGIVEE